MKKYIIWIFGTLFAFFITAFLWNSLFIVQPSLDETIKVGCIHAVCFFFLYIPFLIESKDYK